MRILGLDFGSKTVGVAVSDELLLTAQPVWRPLQRKDENKLRQTCARIEELISRSMEWKSIVLGLPKNMNNTAGETGGEDPGLWSDAGDAGPDCRYVTGMSALRRWLPNSVLMEQRSAQGEPQDR